MISRFATLALAMSMFLPSSYAAPLLAGATTTTFDVFNSSASNPYSGTFLAGSTTNVNNTLWSGVLRSAVLQNTAGTLDFLYQFSNNSASSQMITQLIESSFASYAVNDIGYIKYDFDGGGNAMVNFQAGTAGNSPTSAVRAVNGSTITFNFGTGSNSIAANESSYIMMVRTNAVQWTTGQVQLIDNSSWSNDPSYSLYQPYGAGVPEPGTFALIGLGLVGIAILGRKRV